MTNLTIAQLTAAEAVARRRYNLAATSRQRVVSGLALLAIQQALSEAKSKGQLTNDN